MRSIRSDAQQRRQQVLILRQVAGLSQQETARRLGISERTVRRHEAALSIRRGRGRGKAS